MRGTLLALCLAACQADGPAAEPTHFEAKVAEALNVSLDGTAGFWCVTRPMKVCALHLYAKGSDADSINFTVMNSSRPAVGTYDIAPEMDPTGRSMRANYLSGKKGGGMAYAGKTGKLVITESTPARLKGSFELSAIGTEPVGEAFPAVKLEGSFDAECQLHLRAAYTCE